MKLQVFFFSFVCISSAYSMDVKIDVSKITKHQIINELTDRNAWLKQRYPNHDPKGLGLFISTLRAREITHDEKIKILELMYPVDTMQY